jgi:8-oxo-dGTP pyrophosphatase MutT (NUDIX family)
MTAPVVRSAARVLLLDAGGRVLLFRGHDPVRPEAGSWWFTVGGGVDEGESHRAAAARELFEETGLTLDEGALIGPLHSEVAEFSIAGTSYSQTNEFYAAHVDRHEVDTVGFTDLENELVLEHRWWTPRELRETRDVVFPECLPDLLDRVGA